MKRAFRLMWLVAGVVVMAMITVNGIFERNYWQAVASLIITIGLMIKLEPESEWFGNKKIF